MTLKDRVRQLVKERNWSQAQLAQASGVDSSVLSRLLGGDRPWRKEHIAAVAAALSKTPTDLTAGTDTSLQCEGGEIDAEFIETLTKAHGSLVAENRHLTEELAGLRGQQGQLQDQSKEFLQEWQQCRVDLERERNTRSALQASLRACQTEMEQLLRELSAAKCKKAFLEIELQSARSQVAKIHKSYGEVVELANRNYVVAKDLEQRLSSAKGFAAVTGILGLAMAVGSTLNSDPPKPRRRGRA